MTQQWPEVAAEASEKVCKLRDASVTRAVHDVPYDSHDTVEVMGIHVDTATSSDEPRSSATSGGGGGQEKWWSDCQPERAPPARFTP